MKHPKHHYIDTYKHNGYIWGYYEKGLHHFVKGNHQEGFKDIAVKDSDLEDGSWKCLAEHDLSHPY